jgi:hypothetical protein
MELVPDMPVRHSPLEHVTVPTTLEDVALQLEMLQTHYDLEYRHLEADRLLLLALIICTTSNSKDDVHAVITAFNMIEKAYA